MYRSDPNNATADKTAQTQIILVLPKTHSPLFYRFQREKNAEVGIAIQESLYQEGAERTQVLPAEVSILQTRRAYALGPRTTTT